MRISISLVFAALVSLSQGQGQTQGQTQAQPGGSTPATCTNMRVRRNAATLSTQEWQNIGNVVARMAQDGWVGRFGASHDRLFSRVHGNTCFFPFHRRYILEYENIGRTYDPNFVVPYWDATQSARNPMADPLLSANALGTNGQGGDNCLADGIQGNSQLTYPNQHCLRRVYDNNGSIRQWYAPEIISSYIQSDTSLARFREDIEYSLHGAVHLGMGGDMNSGYAAQDFSFMVHHANLDRLWWDWQNTHNSYLMYDGNGSNGPASLSDMIPEDSSVPFNGATVESVMVLGYGNVCYTYDSSPSPPQSYPAAGGSAPVNNATPQQQQQNQQPNTQQQPNQQQPNQQQPNQQQRQPPNSNSNRRPVLSGSSNMANRILENSGIQGALGSSAVSRFFPGLNGWRAPNRRRSYQEKKVSGCGEPIPFPPRLTPEWVKMHGYDADRVEMFHKHACEIVEVLNNSTYKSPY
ncbi:hypothetical protein GGH94_002779 [Coemansia aciculifera]|uniref:Tyrosinase copper-binding domain-containing protein n=1 Tax=Coemansia aciculifera TaxID=417176 RepID=A0A9W8ILC5_9FUNG|nr:hypothetical protein GGH94_002779 [Coemansia aciculifera]KAJ2874175.1 hypothetical protein GGH93_002617 [Coemansia aciculifera]